MSSIYAFRPQPTTPSALDRVVARFARAHFLHISPIVGCYECLHNEPRVPRSRLLAAA